MLNYQTMARPYAKAVFEFALEKNQLDDWEKALYFFACLIESEKFKQILKQTYLETESVNFIVSLAKDFIDNNKKNFIRILAKNRKLSLLPKIFLEFVLYKNEYRKEVQVEIFSVDRLTPEQKEKLKIKLEKKLHRKVTLNNQIDKALIGGMIIKTPDFVIDSSIKGQLSQLASQLLF